MHCPYCNQEHSDTATFCPKTGQKIVAIRYCANCGTELRESWKVCPKCGTRVGEIEKISIYTSKQGGKSRQPKKPIRSWTPILFSFLILALIVYLFLPRLGFSFGRITSEVSRVINSSEGGELTLPNEVIIRIPSGSLPKDTQVSIKKATLENAPPLQTELIGVGSAYQINLGHDQLEKPITLEIPFDPALLPSDVEPDQVFLSYYDETTKEWVFAGGEVDTLRNVIILETTHASWWMPTTWNWKAWIAVLNKTFQFTIVDWIEAAKLLTDDCPQTGSYVQVDSSQARNVVQGCVEQDDAKQPRLRIVNPKSFFFEIQPISGGNGYPASTLLSPGEDLEFEAYTSDPAPLIIEASMTRRSGWYLVVHMVINMLPGANQFGIQGRHVACITERLADVSHIAEAVESLLVDKNGAAAAEHLSEFMLDGDAVRRFITAADDCNFGPAPTWSVEGIKQIGGAVSTIMSATDYIANYFAGNTRSQVSFIWAPNLISSKPQGRLIYTTGQLGDQKLWLRDLSKPEPSLLASGAQVYGYGWRGGILYGVSPQQNGVFDVYLAESNGANPILVASGVDQAFAGKSPDGSKILVRKITANGESLDLIDVISGQTNTLVQEAESVFPLFIDTGKSLGFEVTQNGSQSLYVVDVNLQQAPRKLADGQYIYLLSYYDTDHLAWVNYEQGQESVHIFDPMDGSSRELLQAPNIRWAILKDGSVSFTLDRVDGTEQYFQLRGTELQETNGQIVDISPDDNYFIYMKNGHKYIEKVYGNELRQLDAGNLQVIWTRFTTDSQYVIFIASSEDQTEFAMFSAPTFGGDVREIGRFTAPKGSSDPNRGVGTYSYPSGYALETSRKTARGGFVVPLNGSSVLLDWNWLTGEFAGTHKISRVQADGTNNRIISEGAGILPRHPQFTPDGQVVFAIVQGSDGLNKLDLYKADGTSETPFSGASAISYQFTSDGKYAVIGVTTISDGSKIYLFNLDTFAIEYLTEGSDPQLLDSYSLDGIQPWE